MSAAIKSSLVKTANGSSPASIPRDEESRLAALSRYEVLDTPKEKAFDEITKLASFICNTPIAVISFVDRDRQWFKSTVGLDKDTLETDRDVAFCAHAILDPENVLEVQDTTKDERFNTNPLVADKDKLKIRFYAGAPLVSPDDKKALGTLCVIDTKPQQLTATQREMLSSLSHIVVDQLELRLRNRLAKQKSTRLKVAESELRSHNQKLEERNADLEKRLKEAEKNAANILNTPAGGVINMLRMLQKDIGPQHSLANDLEKVINLIGSHKLYEVDVSHAIQHGVPDIDSQTKGFLLTQLSNFTEENQAEKKKDDKKRRWSTHSQMSARRSLLEESAQHVERIDNWDFDAFDLQQITNGSALPCAAYHIISRHDLFTKLNLSQDKLTSFLYNVEEGYLTNPYHNSVHATDVLLACNYLVRSSGLDKHLLPKELLAILVACVVHDLGHPGLNNAFLVNTNNKLAIRHNDRSVLENHHCVQAFKLLFNIENDFLDCIPQSDRQEIRKMIIELVLATDMANHVEIMNLFQNRRKTAEGLDLSNKDDRLLTMKLLIKCADISNPARPRKIYNKWVDAVMEEFFQQGDKEKSLCLPVSAFMDRTITSVPKCQIGFIQFICLPTFSTLVEQFPGSSLALNTLQNNLADWKSKVEATS